MKRLIMLLGILFLLKPIFASASMEIIHVGFGGDASTVILNYKNTGEQPLTNYSVFVDGKFLKLIETRSYPGKTISDTLYLSPGQHLIEVRTMEGAYGKIDVSVSSVKKEVYVTPQVVDNSDKNFVLLFLFVFMLVTSVVLWAVTTRQKL